MHVEHSTFISDPFSFTSVLQNKRHSVFITDTDSRDHRPQCVILGHSSRDALYWKMKMSRNSKHKTTCSTCLHIPQRLKQSVVLLRGTHPPSPCNGRKCVCKKLNYLKLHIQSTNRKRFHQLRFDNITTKFVFYKSYYMLHFHKIILHTHKFLLHICVANHGILGLEYTACPPDPVPGLCPCTLLGNSPQTHYLVPRINCCHCRQHMNTKILNILKS